MGWSQTDTFKKLSSLGLIKKIDGKWHPSSLGESYGAAMVDHPEYGPGLRWAPSTDLTSIIDENRDSMPAVKNSNSVQPALKRLSVRSQNILKQLSYDLGIPLEVLLEDRCITPELLLKTRNCGIKSTREILKFVGSEHQSTSGYNLSPSHYDTSFVKSSLKALSNRSRNVLSSLAREAHLSIETLPQSGIINLKKLERTRNCGTKTCREILSWLEELKNHFDEKEDQQNQSIYMDVPLELLTVIQSQFSCNSTRVASIAPDELSSLTELLEVFSHEHATRKKILSILETPLSQLEFDINWLACLTIYSEHLRRITSRQRTKSELDLILLLHATNPVAKKTLGTEFGLSTERIRQRRKFWMNHWALEMVLNWEVVIFEDKTLVNGVNVGSLTHLTKLNAFRLVGYQGERIWMSDGLIRKCQNTDSKEVLHEALGLFADEICQSTLFLDLAKSRKLKFKDTPQIDIQLKLLQEHLRRLNQPIDKSHLDSLLVMLLPNLSVEYAFRKCLEKRVVIAIGRTGTYIPNDEAIDKGEVTYETIAESLLEKQLVVHTSEIKTEFERVTNTSVGSIVSVSKALSISTARKKSNLFKSLFDHFTLKSSAPMFHDTRGINIQRIIKSPIDLTRCQPNQLNDLVRKKANMLEQPVIAIALHVAAKIKSDEFKDIEFRQEIDQILDQLLAEEKNFGAQSSESPCIKVASDLLMSYDREIQISSDQNPLLIRKDDKQLIVYIRKISSAYFKNSPDVTRIQLARSSALASHQEDDTNTVVVGYDADHSSFVFWPMGQVQSRLNKKRNVSLYSRKSFQRDAATASTQTSLKLTNGDTIIACPSSLFASTVFTLMNESKEAFLKQLGIREINSQGVSSHIESVTDILNRDPNLSFAEAMALYESNLNRIDRA